MATYGKTHTGFQQKGIPVFGCSGLNFHCCRGSAKWPTGAMTACPHKVSQLESYAWGFIKMLSCLLLKMETGSHEGMPRSGLEIREMNLGQT